MNVDFIQTFTNKNIVVLGAGLTGMSCVKFLDKHGLTCVVIDSRETPVDASAFAKQFPSQQLKTGHWHTSILNRADIVITSPGIDLDAEGLRNEIPSSADLLGDVELFCRLNNKPIVAVTGSNGKSTVVSLLAHVADKLGKRAALVGNVGTPVLSHVEDDVDVFIFELSSFQLETLSSMQAKVACVLNLSDDHLDRHKTIENYRQIKQKVYLMSDIAVVNRHEPELYQSLGLNEKSTISFGIDKPSAGDFGVINVDTTPMLAFGDKPLIALSALTLAGMHNVLNYGAVLALGHALDWPLDAMVEHFSSFNGLAHRCQVIASNDGRVWINDSKATNVGATLAALEGIGLTKGSAKLALIAGGEGKGADFTPLQSVFEHTVAHLITLGKDGEQLAQLSKNAVQVKSIEEAVLTARELTNAGDIILLSPACASIDMFANYMARGDAFAAAVSSLGEGQ
ncbi:UDP-N-acetylmuramoyl-L-alanine--D-glutamate ligase [Thalassotalea marina]|uniref:UDP-N-acetylmuramoylalanine--D-glutamate ligase n=1 Tax=Thalassotalea marina TaxID=1673741 RepID=A0A919EHB3_9GAMM|nr:UDP-N-acetylmuramoyl-L-alanine--D-glutamate ligase [Thalassotalea marina]GHF79466.1 UDP-N-acetylmuramoylalanine--D-glutamate ligase [Thalassotalea marina]